MLLDSPFALQLEKIKANELPCSANFRQRETTHQRVAAHRDAAIRSPQHIFDEGILKCRARERRPKQRRAPQIRPREPQAPQAWQRQAREASARSETSPRRCWMR